jgi:hypothetical protein
LVVDSESFCNISVEVFLTKKNTQSGGILDSHAGTLTLVWHHLYHISFLESETLTARRAYRMAGIAQQADHAAVGVRIRLAEKSKLVKPGTIPGFEVERKA